MSQGVGVVESTIDDGFLLVLRHGKDKLPDDLDRLLSFLGTISVLMEEKALELQPDFDLEHASGVELETLHDLQRVVAGKALGVPASSLRDVLCKLAIWTALDGSTGEESEHCIRDRLIMSVRRDLERLGESLPSPGAMMS